MVEIYEDTAGNALTEELLIRAWRQVCEITAQPDTIQVHPHVYYGPPRHRFKRVSAEWCVEHNVPTLALHRYLCDWNSDCYRIDKRRWKRIMRKAR
jgi:hypothetical protein